MNNLSFIGEMLIKRCPYFSILTGRCFLAFFDTMKDEQAGALPLFFHGPDSKQEDVSKMLQFLSIGGGGFIYVHTLYISTFIYK